MNGTRARMFGNPLPQTPHVPEERQLLQAMLDAMRNLPSALRQTLTDHQWSTIPLYLTEYQYAEAQPANTPLVAVRQNDLPAKITSVTVSVPAGATGQIQLGPYRIPVPTGVTTIAPLELLLQTTDVRAITTTGTGPTMILLTGEQLPTFGVLAQ